MEQLMALGMIVGDPDSVTNAFAVLKEELVKEMAARETAQTEVKTLIRAVGDLKILDDKFVTQIPALEEK
jgi:hypothetical protein